MNQQENKRECAAAKWQSVNEREMDAIQCHNCMIGYTTNYLMFASAIFTTALSHGTYKPRVLA